jgi:nucleotide-binding universal stress UspA family protein
VLVDEASGSVDREDVGHASSPAIEAVRARGVALVVAGYDGSERSAEAVRWAASLAHLTGSALRVVWAWQIRDVWDTTIARGHPGSPSLAEMEVVAREQVTEVVTALVADEVPDVDIRLDQGPDAAGILLHAAAEADILVVGSRGRGGATSVLLGSVSSRCVRDATCPVLVIPHHLATRPPGAGP